MTVESARRRLANRGEIAAALVHRREIDGDAWYRFEAARLESLLASARAEDRLGSVIVLDALNRVPITDLAEVDDPARASGVLTVGSVIVGFSDDPGYDPEPPRRGGGAATDGPPAGTGPPAPPPPSPPSPGTPPVVGAGAAPRRFVPPLHRPRPDGGTDRCRAGGAIHGERHRRPGSDARRGRRGAVDRRPAGRHHDRSTGGHPGQRVRGHRRVGRSRHDRSRRGDGDRRATRLRAETPDATLVVRPAGRGLGGAGVCPLHLPGEARAAS